MNAKKKQRPTIGLAVDWLTDTYQTMIVSSVIASTQAADANLLCFAGGTILDRRGYLTQRNAVFDLPDAANVDALILMPGVLGNQIGIEKVNEFCLRYRPLPLVSLGQELPEIPSVLVDMASGLRDLIHHLVEDHGYTRIANLRGIQSGPAASERYKIWAETMTEIGLAVDPNLISTHDRMWSWGGAEGTQRLLDEQRGNFDAIMAFNDSMALGALEVLSRNGIVVPHEVAVVGYDDIEDGRLIIPPLTTVRQPLEEMGRVAVELALRQIAGEDVPHATSVATEVVVRQSCGCQAFPAQQIYAVEAQESRPLTQVVTADRKSILSSMTEALDAGENLPSDWAAELLDSFVADATSETPDTFLPQLHELLRLTAQADDDIAAWHSVLSALDRHVLPALVDDPDSLLKFEKLAQLACMSIGEMAAQVQAYRRLQARKTTEAFNEALRGLLTSALDISDILTTLTESLRRLEITSCYLSLYEPQDQPATTPADDDPLGAIPVPPDRARLIYVLEHGTAQTNLDPATHRFPSRRLVPEGYLCGDRPHALLVESLYFHNEQLGFILLALTQQQRVYDTLVRQIGYSLKIALLLAEQARATDKITQQAHELARSNQALEQFAYAASHDLQEPLRMVNGYLTLLGRRYKDQLDEEANEFIAFAVDGANRMQTLIQDLLKYARAGTQNKPLQPVDCNQAVSTALENLQVQIEESRAQITHDELPTVMAIPTQMIQLFQNLISNGIKFRKQEVRPTIHVAVEEQEGHWRFSVRDNGIGIAEEHFDRIFEIFQRLHSSGQYEGTGIGLALCKKVVEGHGGKVWVASEPGEGTTFFFTIPIIEGSR